MLIVSLKIYKTIFFKLLSSKKNVYSINDCNKIKYLRYDICCTRFVIIRQFLERHLHHLTSTLPPIPPHHHHQQEEDHHQKVYRVKIVWSVWCSNFQYNFNFILCYKIPIRDLTLNKCRFSISWTIKSNTAGARTRNLPFCPFFCLFNYFPFLFITNHIYTTTPKIYGNTSTKNI